MWFRSVIESLQTRSSRPPFITALAAEDRWHLNGLAMRNGRPTFVTALGETDTPGGWRPAKSQGGVVMDVASGEFVTRGLSMPHSPRCHDGRLWVLESGTDGVVVVDPATGRRETVVQLPGFTRGWALVGTYAFVGLSKIRPTSAMNGVPIAERRDELKCGVPWWTCAEVCLSACSNSRPRSRKSSMCRLSRAFGSPRSSDFKRKPLITRLSYRRTGDYQVNLAQDVLDETCH